MFSFRNKKSGAVIVTKSELRGGVWEKIPEPSPAPEEKPAKKTAKKRKGGEEA